MDPTRGMPTGHMSAYTPEGQLDQVRRIADGLMPHAERIRRWVLVVAVALLAVLVVAGVLALIG